MVNFSTDTNSLISDSKTSKVSAMYSVTFSLQTKTIFTGMFPCKGHLSSYLFYLLFLGAESGDILGWSLDKFLTKSEMKPHDPKKKHNSGSLVETAYTGRISKYKI